MNIRIFDLEQRTARFGEEVINFCKSIQKNEITRQNTDIFSN